ncbi:MAG: SU10 major capsid protein [Bacteroidales bacterium]
MATLKSFELKGNKQSFANFISNLSPCDSPFTSMIGKEVIDETQYSWQTDSLAPADNTSAAEGSQAEFQTRATTTVYTNFTSILRTVASVSDTVKELGLNGRNKEMSYQMGKAGKEILRDLEYMTLHNLNGHLGTKTRASSFAGFEGLVAGQGVADADSGAVVHKLVEVSGVNFDKDDLFDITMNLYLVGSKADKIMFHPRFATAFSDLITNDYEAEHTYRMFDNLGTTYNAQVKTIKDPLGRVYTLIPNRYMPEDKFYIFHESDWTQTVLRAPGASKLAKNGSSEQYMIEMEVGLRHRHPYASGILAFREVTIANDFVPTKKAFTSSLQEQQDVKASITVDWVAEKDLDVHFHTTDEEIVRFENRVVKTDTGGLANNRMQIGRKSGIAEVWTVCKGVKSVVTRIVVGAPKVVLTVDEHYPAIGQKITLTAAIEKADGSPTGAGHAIDWYVSHSSYLELDSVKSFTNETGFAQTTGTVRSIDEFIVQAIFDTNHSDTEIINYIPQPEALEDFSVIPNTVPVDGFSEVSVKVLDEAGDPMVNETVVWITSDPNVGRTVIIGSPTNSEGIARQALKGISRGTATIHAEVAGIESPKIQFYVGYNALFDLDILPNPATDGEEVVFHGNVQGADGHPIQDLKFVIRSDPADMRLDMDTDEEGDYTGSHIFGTNSDYEIIVEVPSLGIIRKENLTFNP